MISANVLNNDACIPKHSLLSLDSICGHDFLSSPDPGKMTRTAHPPLLGVHCISLKSLGSRGLSVFDITPFSLLFDCLSSSGNHPDQHPDLGSLAASYSG